LTILGGEHDGKIVDDHGPVMLMPVPPPLTIRSIPLVAAELESPPEFLTDRYHAQQDDDGRWWYVLERRAS
jgi:hypothetical protein